MRDGQEANERAVLKELQDFRFVRQAPEDDNNAMINISILTINQMAVMENRRLCERRSLKKVEKSPAFAGATFFQTQ